MAIDPTYARGARGDVVLALQQALTKIQVPSETGAGTEPALAGADGSFDIKTQRAVQRVQQHRNRLMTGVVDKATWGLLMGAEPWPPVFERMLYVAAGFEGHFYSKSTGDNPPKDRVGMTWGLIGFTLVQPEGTSYRKGPLCGLLEELFLDHRDLMVDAFGTANATRLEAALALDAPKLRKFAVDNLSSAGGQSLRSPWREGFHKLGEHEEVRTVQRETARTEYFDRALALATDFGQAYGMECERTLLYFLDLTIHNGNLKENEPADARAAIARLIVQQPNASVAQKLQCITEVLALARPPYAADIRQRKGTIAFGFGTVHGNFYRLEGWGIDVAEPGPPQPQPLRLAVIGLDGQQKEQLALARETKNLLLAEEAAAEPLAIGRFPARTGHRLLHQGGTRSVAMPGLAASGSATLNPNFTDHYEAAQMLFRGEVGVLAVSGQSTMPLGTAAAANHYVLQRAGRTFAGTVLQANGQLLLTRQRASGEAVAESLVDITELRRSLGSCRLLMLYGAFGVPIELQSGSGPHWREWVRAAGGNPIVLGWFGNVRTPQDAQGLTVADAFLARVRLLRPGAGLMEILRDLPLEVIEEWGAACHQVFAASRQKYLWLEEPVPTVLITKSGAAAIDPGGAVWRANTDFGKKPGEPAMKKV